jgi:hypothetical protein
MDLIPPSLMNDVNNGTYQFAPPNVTFSNNDIMITLIEDIIYIEPTRIYVINANFIWMFYRDIWYTISNRVVSQEPIPLNIEEDEFTITDNGTGVIGLFGHIYQESQAVYYRHLGEFKWIYTQHDNTRRVIVPTSSGLITYERNRTNQSSYVISIDHHRIFIVFIGDNLRGFNVDGNWYQFGEYAGQSFLVGNGQMIQYTLDQLQTAITTMKGIRELINLIDGPYL